MGRPGQQRRPPQWLLAAALVAVTYLVYQPAWRGGLVWDDDVHVTPRALQSWHGLSRIWLDLGATPQYYPLTHTVFWIEHRLWGDATLGYHLVNVAMHAAVALLLVVVLKRLAIPGAWLAAAIFVLHPVQVESVAWITELKNTLSAVFYMGAGLAYLRFDERRTTGRYACALAIFTLGLLSKSVIATLPAALLVALWWRRGRLGWRHDIVPLVPFFLLGAAAGLFTAWVEQALVGARGAAFNLTILQRSLIAGRAVWFYVGTLVWPVNLTFIYPRWQVSGSEWSQSVYLVAALALLGLCWAIRHRTRGPLAMALYFIATLAPVLGFLNVYPFLYSFVADHFQYLASVGVITAFSAAAARGMNRLSRWGRSITLAGCATLLVVLSLLTWRQSHMYASEEALYRTTLARNPQCLLAYTNLGASLAGRGQVDEAIGMYGKALALSPDDVDANNNLGVALAGRGQTDEAVARFQKALAVNPRYAKAHNNLGIALAGRGQTTEAMAHFQQALEVEPEFAEAHYGLGIALAASGRTDEAIAHYQKALEIEPDHAGAHNNLGVALSGQGRADEAVAHFRRALEIAPDFAEARCNLGVALAARGEIDQAVAEYEKVLGSSARDGEAAAFARAQIARYRPDKLVR